jgi:hypothetical protein
MTRIFVHRYAGILSGVCVCVCGNEERKATAMVAHMHACSLWDRVRQHCARGAGAVRAEVLGGHSRRHVAASAGTRRDLQGALCGRARGSLHRRMCVCVCVCVCLPLLCLFPLLAHLLCCQTTRS